MNVFQLKMWIFLIIKAQNKLRKGEILSLRILVTNKWSEPVDALVSIPASKDYKFVQVDREQASNTESVKGEHQVYSIGCLLCYFTTMYLHTMRTKVTKPK